MPKHIKSKTHKTKKKLKNKSKKTKSNSRKQYNKLKGGAKLVDTFTSTYVCTDQNLIDLTIELNEKLYKYNDRKYKIIANVYDTQNVKVNIKHIEHGKSFETGFMHNYIKFITDFFKKNSNEKYNFETNIYDITKN